MCDNAGERARLKTYPTIICSRLGLTPGVDQWALALLVYGSNCLHAALLPKSLGDIDRVDLEILQAISLAA